MLTWECQVSDGAESQVQSVLLGVSGVNVCNSACECERESAHENMENMLKSTMCDMHWCVCNKRDGVHTGT